MTEQPHDPLTPPGPGMRPPYAPPPSPSQSAPTQPPSRGADKGLGWTGFALALVTCFPLLPLVGAVLALVTLLRRRFRPTWVAVLALLIGLSGTALQVAVVTSDDFWDGFRDALNDNLEEETGEARRSGEPTEVSPLKLRPGDCINDAASKGLSDAGETVEKTTVTLLPCRDKHDLEVYATLELPGDDYPGRDAIDRFASRCFGEFHSYVGRAYPRSELEVYYYFPTKRSWKLLGDKVIACLAGHPKRKIDGSVKDSRR